MDTGSIGFILFSAAFVFLMTPALAFFYGGLARRKNVLNTMMACMYVCGIGIVMWILFGYSLSFGSDHGGVIGGFDFLGFQNVSMTESTKELSIPDACFALFQMMFAIITPALFTGSVVGRMKFKSLILFTALWSLVVYYPLAHMVWGGGFLAAIGSVDFAGGNVVHISSGVTGLTLALLLGNRREYHRASYAPHNVPYVVLGAALLWFGWFGFNAGSALAADGLAVHAFATTAVSSASALVSWMIIDTVMTGKPTVVGCCTGLVVGLVAITPGCGFVPIWASIVIGLLVSPLCYFGVILLKKKLKIDDALDAFGCHGIGGIWGGLATGLFAMKQLPGGVESSAQWDGLVFGDYHLFLAQVESIVITIAIAVVGTLICYGIVRLFGKVRVSEQEEKLGMDLSQHGENAYPTFNGMD